MNMTEPKSFPVPKIVPDSSTTLATGGAPWGASAPSMWLDSPQEAGGLNFTRFLHSFRRKWLWGCLIGLVLAPLTAGLLWFLVPVRYQAEGLVRVSMSEREILPDLIGRQAPNQQEFESFRETQVDLIKSPFILQSVLRKDDIRALPMIRREGEGLGPLAMLQRKLSVTANPKAEIVKISLTGRNEEEVKKIVDGVMDAYLEEAHQSERGFRFEALQTLNDQKAANEKQIVEGYKKIDSLATQYGTEDSKMAETKKDVAHQELQSLLRSREDIQTEIQNLQLDYFVLENKRRNKSIKPDDMMIEDEMEKDPSYMELKKDLNELEQQIAASGGAMRAGSATANRFQGQIQMMREALAKRRAEMEPRVRDRLRRNNYGDDQIAIATKSSELQTAIQVANARAEKIEKDLNEKKAELEKLSGFSAELEARKKLVENLEDANDRIAGEIQRLDLQTKKPPRVQRIQPATIPNAFANLIRLLSIGLASALVFVLSVFGTAFHDYLQHLLSSAGELEKETNLPVLGTIPSMLGNARQREFLAATSVDSIRAAITRGDRAKDMNSVMISSAIGKEGKSTVASQLAVSLARSGRRTVLVDGDIRHPQLHLFFALPGDRGVCDVLRGEATVEELTQTTPSENLWVVPAGRVDVNSFQSLSGKAVGELIDQLRQRFDFVVIDTAPVLTGPEPLVFGQYVQGTVLTARKDISCVDKIDEAFRRLQSVGIRVLGSVILGGKSEVRSERLALPAA
jgi:polysaccharide biosynthesis transport protein